MIFEVRFRFKRLIQCQVISGRELSVSKKIGSGGGRDGYVCVIFRIK